MRTAGLDSSTSQTHAPVSRLLMTVFSRSDHNQGVWILCTSSHYTGPTSWKSSLLTIPDIASGWCCAPHQQGILSRMCNRRAHLVRIHDHRHRRCPENRLAKRHEWDPCPFPRRRPRRLQRTRENVHRFGAVSAYSRQSSIVLPSSARRFWIAWSACRCEEGRRKYLFFNKQAQTASETHGPKDLLPPQQCLQTLDS